MVLLIAIVAVLVILLICFVVSYNGIIILNNNVKEAFATMDVFLKKRWDLLPNLIEVIKSYDKYEKSTLKEIVKLRNTAYDSMNSNDKIEANEKLTKSINKILALAEAYPDLKSNQNYLDLSNQLVSIEDEIAESRKYYNAVVRNYNNKIQTIPTNLVAKLFKFTVETMFEATEEEKKSIKVKL